MVLSEADVDAALNRAAHLVAGAEHALEQPEFLAQQLVDALHRPVFRFRKLTTVTSIFWPNGWQRPMHRSTRCGFAGSTANRN